MPPNILMMMMMIYLAKLLIAQKIYKNILHYKTNIFVIISSIKVKHIKVGITYYHMTCQNVGR